MGWNREKNRNCAIFLGGFVLLAFTVRYNWLVILFCVRQLHTSFALPWHTVTSWWAKGLMMFPIFIFLFSFSPLKERKCLYFSGDTAGLFFLQDQLSLWMVPFNLPYNVLRSFYKLFVGWNGKKPQPKFCNFFILFLWLFFFTVPITVTIYIGFVMFHYR